jgi:hypothetical protein
MTAGGGGDTTTAAVEGSLTMRPGEDAPPLSWRRLHGSRKITTKRTTSMTTRRTTDDLATMGFTGVP